MEKNSRLYNIFTVLVGALLVGAMWRVRGTHGWGSEMGVLNVGFMFAMFAMLIKGSRQKLNLGWFGLTVAAFVATTPAWGTFLTQITGYFEATDTNLPSFETSPISGIIIMLILGFGISSLYGILLGRGFSSKQWKIQHLIVLLVVFFGPYYLFGMSLSSKCEYCTEIVGAGVSIGVCSVLFCFDLHPMRDRLIHIKTVKTILFILIMFPR